MEFLNRLKGYVPGHQARKNKEQAELEQRERARKERLEQAEQKLDALRQDIRELGHEFADALRQGIRKGTQKKQLESSQAEFELAISRFTGMNAADIKELVPRVYFLQLKEYLHRQEQDEDPHVTEALHEAYQQGPIGSSRRERHATKKTMREVLEAHGYDGEEAKALLERDRLYAKQEGLDAAVESLAQESLEAAQQFRGIEHDSIEEVVRRAEEAFKHPSIEPHLKNSVDSIKIGVREIVGRALYEHAKRLQDLGEKTLRECSIPSEYSTGRSLTIDEYLHEIEEALNNKKLIREQAEYKKSYAEKKVNELRNLDTLISELTRYAERGATPIPEGPDEFNEWGWGEALKTYPPEALKYPIRKLIQSITQKEAKTILLARKSETQSFMQQWQEEEGGRASFARAFGHILRENLGRQWSGAVYGRDKMHFLHRDIQENLVTTRQIAERPLVAFETGIRQNLEKIRRENIALLDAMDDIEDLVNNPDILSSIKEIGRQIDALEWAEATAQGVQQSLENIRMKAREIENNVAYYVGNEKEEQVRLLNWLAHHPIKDMDAQKNREAA